MNDTPPIAPRTSVEKLHQLENIIQDLKIKNQALENENTHFRTYSKELENQVSRLNLRSTLNDDGNNSIALINDTFVDVASSTLCNEIENYIEQTNDLFTDENEIRTSFGFLVDKLVSLISIQSTTKDLIKLKKVKDDLFKKLNFVDDKIKTSTTIEMKFKEVESLYDRLKIDSDAIKETLNNKQLIDTSQIDFLRDEFIKYKTEIESIHDKVKEQNDLINQLVIKCEPLIIQKNSTMNTEILLVEKKNDNSSPINIPKQQDEIKTDNVLTPGSSPTIGFFSLNSLLRKDTNKTTNNKDNNNNNNKTSNNSLIINNDYQSYAIYDTLTNNDTNQTLIPSREESVDVSRSTENNNNNNNNNNDNNIREPQTIVEETVHNYDNPNAPYTVYDDEFERQKSLQVYQCPFCFTQISSDSIPFETFYEHVNNCNSNRLTCIFCLKLFDKNNENEYMKHVQEHE